MAEMVCELKVNTLEGGVLTVQVTPTNTIQELEVMLCEKKYEDPIEHKILKAEILVDGALVPCDARTLKAAGLLDAECDITVIYSRNEVEAATKEAIYAKGFVQVNIPASLVEISDRAFENCHQLVRVVIPESVTAIGDRAFERCSSLGSITIPESVMAIGNWKSCLSLLHFFGKHHNPWVCDNYWGKCLPRVQFFRKHHYPRVCDSHWGKCL